MATNKIVDYVAPKWLPEEMKIIPKRRVLYVQMQAWRACMSNLCHSKRDRGRGGNSQLHLQSGFDTDESQGLRSTPHVSHSFTALIRQRALGRHPTVAQMGHLGTPIQSWKLPEVPEDVEVWVKRDDMTGAELGGNKIRKLEFLLADALDQGCTNVLTMGGLQSNHCCITALACARLGLKCHLFLRSNLKNPDIAEVQSCGNLLLNKLGGASIYLLPRGTKENVALTCMERRAQQILEDRGEKSYIIPGGGSSALGAYGYIQAFDEMLQQGAAASFTDVVVCVGSGGTLEGLAIANHLSGADLRIHGINVCDDADCFYSHMQQTLEEVGLPELHARDLAHIIDGHQGSGYGLSTPEELEFIKTVARETGVIVDRTYIGKVVRGMVHELNHNRGAFRGNKVLFIHTGGIFGVFDGELSSSLDGASANVTVWPV